MKGAIKLGLRPRSRWPCRNLPGDNDRDFINGSICYWQAPARAGKSGSQQTQPSLCCAKYCVKYVRGHGAALESRAHLSCLFGD